jgi:hypothetical protein
MNNLTREELIIEFLKETRNYIQHKIIKPGHFVLYRELYDRSMFDEFHKVYNILYDDYESDTLIFELITRWDEQWDPDPRR